MRSKMCAVTALLVALTVMVPAHAGGAAKPEYSVAVSIYVGWMPWYYAKESGIMKKWADRYGIKVNIEYMDYIPSVEAFVTKKADACLMTNMEMLDMPCAAGVDASAIIVGDFSNGNDACLVRNNLTIEGLKGKDVLIVQNSVSHYLLFRILDQHGLTESDVNMVNTADSQIKSAFADHPEQKAVVTWNPMVMQIEQQAGIKKIFDSSQIPGEILDLMVIRTEVLKKDPRLAQALTGTWYEVLDLMTRRGDPQREKAVAMMAQLSSVTPTEYTGQLRTTAMFWKPQDAIAYSTTKDFQSKMDSVRQFCFKHGLLGETAKSVDIVGIVYPDGSVQGDAKNIKMRFDMTYMQQAADGSISLK